MSSSRSLVLAAIFGACLLTACGSSDDASSSSDAVDTAAVATTYANIVVASYDASIKSAKAMQKAIDKLLGDPSKATLAAARKQWLSARDDYVITEPFRFYGGPIDDPDTGLEGQINAWPMDEAYIDYVKGDADAGIINDRKDYPKVTPDVLTEANEQGGETNISTGWHAIEFLLWGQDQSKTGPGDRPASDYSSAANSKRRAQYLRLTTQQLVADLQTVRAPWDPQDGEFRKSFLSDPNRALRRILRGIGALDSSELAGERMAVAFESRDQEDEHSCFSDNTNADVVNDIKGIRMVYLADYPGVSGPSLNSLLADKDPDLAKQIEQGLDTALAKAEAFPATFETMIRAADGSPDRKAMGAVITDLEQEGERLTDAASALNVKVGFEA